MSDRDGDKTHGVTTNQASGLNTTTEVPKNRYILNAAPFARHTGACVICDDKVIEGSISQPEHNFLKAEELKADFVLACMAYADSDYVILTHRKRHCLNLNKADEKLLLATFSTSTIEFEQNRIKIFSM